MNTTGYGDRLAARQAQTVGEGPRIEALADSEMSGEARAIVDAVRASAGAGPALEVPDYMRTIAKHPGLFKGQMDTGKLFFNGLYYGSAKDAAIP